MNTYILLIDCIAKYLWTPDQPNLIKLFLNIPFQMYLIS